MKVTSKHKTIGFALVLGVFSFACNQEPTTDVNEGINAAQMEAMDVNEEALEARRDFKEFETWAQDKLNRAETATREEWAGIRAEYQRRRAELEEKRADWDEETREEWEELEAQWDEAENKIRQRLGNIDDVDVDVDVERQNN